MSDPLLSVVILTLNEEIDLPGCLESLEGLDADIFVVDSGSTDRTLEIARQSGCTIVTHAFENYASQQNWALDNLPIRTAWTLCIDAGERLLPALAREIQSVLSRNEVQYDGYILRKRTVFMGRWIRHGGQYPNCHLNLFRTGKGRCEARLYDQHFIVPGRVRMLKNDYVDKIAANLESWTARHNVWAGAEAVEIMQSARVSKPAQVTPSVLGNRIERIRFLRKNIYQNFPLFLRPFLFWFYSYFIRLGFLDGKEGLIFFTLQRFWFRFLVDARIYEYSQQRKQASLRKKTKKTGHRKSA